MKDHLLGMVVLVAVTLFTPRIAVGQDLTTRYVFAGPIVNADSQPPVIWGGGGGVERLAARNTYVGGEVEGVYVPAYTAPGCCVSGRSQVGFLFSLNGTYYLARSTNGPKWEPFVTGAIGAIAAGASQGIEFAAPVYDFGGGIDRWLTPHRSVRFEIQEKILGFPMLALRVGVIFR